MHHLPIINMRIYFKRNEAVFKRLLNLRSKDARYMKGISINVIRNGKKYRLINFGDTSEFEVLQFLERDNYQLKDVHTLEKYQLKELLQFGKGPDFSIEEL